MIDINKKYKTRDGREVVLYCTDAPGRFCVHGRIDNMAQWDINGIYHIHMPDNLLDLIEVSPYEDFKIDEPVMVKQKDEDVTKWRKRHFAGISETGVPMAWDCGFTSWTSTSSVLKAGWDKCRRPTEEELKS